MSEPKPGGVASTSADDSNPNIVRSDGPVAYEGIPPMRYVTDKESGVTWILPRATSKPKPNKPKPGC